MNELAHSALSGWESFYVIVGSSGAALIGLQLVVITLIADGRARGSSGSIAACGIIGVGYGAIVVARARRQTDYAPVFEDWLWHAILPCGAYAALLLSAVFLRAGTRTALFVIAAAALSLLLIGIHNAWDTVTYIAVDARRDRAAAAGE
jgi:hypothetical protein